MFTISKFSYDITPPMGSPLCGGPMIDPAKSIDDPQYVLGFVLQGAGDPIVFATADCVGFYNYAHDRFIAALAKAAGTIPKRVMVTSVHQHDAPMHEPDAQQILDDHNLEYGLCNPEHYFSLVEGTAAALKESLSTTQRVTHIGSSRTQVEKVASNRRLLGEDGKVEHVRGSSCYDPMVRELPVGVIDPDMTAVSLFDGDRPVVTISHYATHPMSVYGKGRVSADFCGLARARRLADDPDCLQLYVTGCAGNIGAGKYNDGSDGIRDVLTDRIYTAMKTCTLNMQIKPLETIDYKTVSMQLPVREDPEFTEQHCLGRLRGSKDRTDEASTTAAAMQTGTILGQDLRHIALTLSWRRRAQEPIDVPVLDLGAAKLLLLPGEPFVEYQLQARQMCPDDVVMIMGYGNAGPGYLCTDIAYEQGGYESRVPAYTGRGAEAILIDTLRTALDAGS
jgi:hypothetical protein